MNTEKPPIPLSWHDALSESDYIYGEDRNAPLGKDDEPLAWEGELIDGYPNREGPVETLLKKRKKAQASLHFSKVVQAELTHVQPAPDTVRLYVARLRTARRLGMSMDQLHAEFYGGKRPEGLERLADMGFTCEAKWAGWDSDEAHMQDDEAPDADPRDVQTAEARLARFDAFAALMVEGMDDGTGSGFAPNDNVEDGENGPAGVVSKVDPSGSVTVRRNDEKGTEVTYSDPSKLKRQASKEVAADVARLEREIAEEKARSNPDRGWLEDMEDTLARQKTKLKQANQPNRPGQTHNPKGTEGVKDEDGNVVSGVGVTALQDPHIDEKALKNASLEPADEIAAVLTWPNLTMYSNAIPKLAQRDWMASLDRAVVRGAGSWHPDPVAWDLTARFPTKESAHRFAKQLVEDFHVNPSAIEGKVEKVAGQFFRVGSVRVDMARRILLPGGIVFALEGSASPSNFQVNEPVLVMDGLTSILTEGKVAAVGPEVAVVVTYDGQQYEFARGLLQKLHLAKLNLAHARPEMLPDRQEVLVGDRKGTIAAFDRDKVRVKLDDGPRWFPREQVTALVRVAFLPKS